MPRFPVQRSTRVPGFVSTPQPNTIEGAPGLRAVADAVTGFAQGVAPGLARAEARQKRIEGNNADIQLTKWEIEKEKRLGDLNEKYFESTDQQGYEAEYAQVMQDLDSEFLGDLNEDQLARIEEQRLKTNARFDETMAGYSAGIGLNAKMQPIKNRFESSVLALRQAPGLLEDRIGQMDSFLAESDDGTAAHKVAVEKFNQKMKPILVETAIEKAVKDMDFTTLRDIESALERGRYDLDPSDENDFLAHVRRGISNVGTNYRSKIVSESQNAVKLSADPFKNPTWTPQETWDTAISTATTEQESTMIKRAKANEDQAREIWQYSRDLWNASSTDRSQMKRDINRQLQEISLSEVASNEEKLQEYGTLKAKVDAISRQEQFIRDNPYAAMDLSNPALRQMQSVAFESGDPAAISEYVEAAIEEQYRNTAFMDNPPPFKVLGPLMAGEFAKNIKDAPTLKEQAARAKATYGSFDSSYAQSIRAEIEGEDEAVKRAFVASAVNPGLVDSYEAAIQFQANNKKLFDQTKAEINAELQVARRQMVNAVGQVVKVRSRDFGIIEQMATDATIAQKSDPSLQAGDTDVATLYERNFEMAMGDNAINGTILVTPSVKKDFPALAVDNTHYGQPIRKNYAFNRYVADYIKQNGGMVMPTDYVGNWEDLLLSEDDETPTTIEFRWNGKIGKYTMWLQDSRYELNVGGRPIGLTPEEYHNRPSPEMDLVPMSDYELIGGAFIAVGRGIFGAVNKDPTSESEWIKRTLEPAE